MRAQDNRSEASYTLQSNNDKKEKIEEFLEFKKNWEELGFFDKMKFFDFWFIFSIISNFIQINGSITSILYEVVRQKLKIFEMQEGFIGFGCMFSWLLMLKYLEYTPNISLMTSTLSNASSTMFTFFISVIPFFLGYVFLGI